MNVITYLKDVPVMRTVFGYALVLLGLTILFFANIIFGTIFIFLGLNFVSTEGAQIDVTTKTYRTIKSIFGIHFGKWQPCPEFEYVSVFKTKESQTVNVVTASATSVSDVILLNLFYNTNKHHTFYKTTDKADAFKVAGHFKMVFDIDILDATESEKKWL